MERCSLKRRKSPFMCIKNSKWLFKLGGIENHENISHIQNIEIVLQQIHPTAEIINFSKSENQLFRSRINRKAATTYIE